ncbi:MAG TPA: hypothetical protein PLZ37_00760 [Nitrospira sp.]|nr:hypothetical protein [Nitrospira sp.]
MKFSTHAEKWLDELVASPETKRKYRCQVKRDILPTFGAFDLDSITNEMVSGWLRDRVTHYGRSQLTALATRLRDVLDLAVKRRHLSKHLFQKKTLTQVLRLHGYDGPASSRKPASYVTPDIVVPNGGAQMFEEFASEWMHHHSNNRLVREERTHFMESIWIPAFRGHRLDSIDRLNILEVIVPLQKKISLADCKRAISLLDACLHEAVATGCITYNPAHSWSHCMNVPEADPEMNPKEAAYPQKRLATNKCTIYRKEN